MQTYNKAHALPEEDFSSMSGREEIFLLRPVTNIGRTQNILQMAWLATQITGMLCDRLEESEYVRDLPEYYRKVFFPL